MTAPSVEGAPREREDLPPCWTFDARGMGFVNLADTPRPWNWIALNKVEAGEVWSLLGDFVAFFNGRYAERQEQTIPPCWAEHGWLVEEMTTLCWARWHAFEGEDASIGGAQFWHSYTLPMFLDRMAKWIGSDRLRKCQAGNHATEPRSLPAQNEDWTWRVGKIARLDLDLRRAPRPKPPKAPEKNKDGTEPPPPSDSPPPLAGLHVLPTD